MQKNLRTRKLVVVGDGWAGKTSLLYAFKDQQFALHHVPTIFETYSAEVSFDNETIRLSLFDTAGQEEFDRLRPMSYPSTDVVLICFSVDKRTSLDHVVTKWNPEIRHFCKQVPVILVACKIDLRVKQEPVECSRTRNIELISCREGFQVSKDISADLYKECSAKTREGISDLLIEAARLSAKKKKINGRTCILL